MLLNTMVRMSCFNIHAFKHSFKFVLVLNVV